MARFTCPRCGKAYPMLPSLVDRRVRCNACKGAFQLQRNGTAIAIDSTHPPESDEEAAQVKAKTTSGMPQPDLQDGPASSAANAGERISSGDGSSLFESGGHDGKDADRDAYISAVSRTWVTNGTAAETRQDQLRKLGAKPRSKRFVSRQEALKKSLNNRLKGAAEAAADAVATDERPLTAAVGSAQGKAKPQPRVIGDGFRPTTVREPGAPSGRRPLLFLLATAIVMLLVAWVAWPSDDLSAALEAFSESPNSNTYPERHRAHLDRAWAPMIGDGRVLLVMLNLPEAERSAPSQFDGQLVEFALADMVVGTVYWPRAGAWVKVDDMQEITQSADGEAVVSAQLEREAWRAACTEAGIAFVTVEQVETQLREVGLDEIQCWAVMAVLCGVDGDQEPSEAARRLLAGLWPDRWSVCRLQGDDGWLLRSVDSRYRVFEGRSYDGIVVRCSGLNWPRVWRVADLCLPTQRGF